MFRTDLFTNTITIPAPGMPIPISMNKKTKASLWKIKKFFGRPGNTTTKCQRNHEYRSGVV